VIHLHAGTFIHGAEVVGGQEPPWEAQSPLRCPPVEMPKGSGDFPPDQSKPQHGAGPLGRCFSA